MDNLNSLGGSHAQRDVFDETLLQAYIYANNTAASQKMILIKAARMAH